MFDLDWAAARRAMLCFLIFYPKLAGQVTGTIHESGILGVIPRLPNVPSQLKDPYFRADELRREGRNEEALQLLKEAVQTDPGRGELYALRSGIFGNLQQYEAGVVDGDRGIELSTTPRNKALAAYHKGFNLTGLNRKEEALKAYGLALRLDPNYSMAHFGKGKLYYFLRMWKEAKGALGEALRLNPKLGAAWAYMAEAHFVLGEMSEGMASAERAVELTPSDPRAFRARAIGHQLHKQYENMLADATRAVELEPTRPLAHLLRGKAFGFLGRLDEATSEFALETDRKAVEPYLNGVHLAMYGTRIYNCGDFSTEIQTPISPPIDSFSDCVKRIDTALQEAASSSAVKTPARRRSSRLPLPRKRAR